jgi:hypothetical protein
MAGEQTAYLDSGSTGTDVVIAINCIDSTGSHTALTIDTTTTRLHGYSVVPTADLSVGTGIATITFANVQSLTEGQRLICKVNGTAGGVAFSEYAIPVIVRADERGTDSVTSLDAAGVRTAVGLASANLDTQLSNINTQVGTIDGIVDNILVDTGTDIPASIAALNDFDPTTDTVANVTTVGSVTNAVTTDTASRDASKADVSALATSAEIAALNNFDPATDQVIVGTNTDKTDYALSSAANDAIGAAFLAYTLTKGSPGTIERAFWQSLKATQLADGEVSGTPTASAFDTNLTAVTGAYDHLLLLFTSGSLAGEARPIATYNATNGRITLQEALTSAPSSADEFIVVPDHSRPVSEIVEGIFNEPQAGYTTAGTFGYYLDSQVSAAGGAVDTAAIADAVWDESRAGHTTSGTFGYYLDAQVSTAGSGGSGLYQVSVLVQDASNAALQGARINVDGTVLTLTTDSSGIVTFNLDSGVYLLTCSPPAGYDTPTSLVATVTNADISKEFTLTPTSSAACDVPWVG